MNVDVRFRLVWSLSVLLLACAPSSPGAATNAASPSALATNAATIATPKGSAWRAMHRHDAELAAQGGIDLLFLGDDAAFGWPRQGEAFWNQKLKTMNPAAFGIPLDRSENLLWRLQNGELANLRPKTVVLSIGSMNLQWVSDEGTPEATAEGVKTVLDELRTRLPQTRIVLMSILPRQPQFLPLQHRVRLTNKILAGFADGKQILFLGINDRLCKASDKNPDPEFYEPDMLHLNAKGYAVWGEELLKLLKE